MNLHLKDCILQQPSPRSWQAMSRCSHNPPQCAGISELSSVPAIAHAALKKWRAGCRFGPWVRAWGVQDGDTLGLELHGGDPCRMRMHVRPPQEPCGVWPCLIQPWAA